MTDSATKTTAVLPANGETPGPATHRPPVPPPPAFTCWAFDTGGRVLLTRRASTGATWSGSCCDCSAPDGPLPEVVARRLRAELGVRPARADVVAPAVPYRTAADHRITGNGAGPVVRVLLTGQPAPDPAVVVETRWVSWADLVRSVALGVDLLPPWDRLAVQRLAALGPDPWQWPQLPSGAPHRSAVPEVRTHEPDGSGPPPGCLGALPWTLEPEPGAHPDDRGTEHPPGAAPLECPTTDLVIPIPSTVDPYQVPGGQQHLSWLRRHGLLTDDRAEQRYRASGVWRGGSFFFPYANGADRDLGFAVSGLFFAIDDSFDEPADHGRALNDCQELINLVIAPTAPRASDRPAVVAAFADFWDRVTTGMTPEWCTRAAHEWAGYFYGHFTEVANSRIRPVPAPEVLMRLRLTTIGFLPTVSTAERIYGFEVPTPALYSSHVQLMIDCARHHVIITNDLYSLRKEEAQGERNLVHSLMHHHGCTRRQAVDRLVAAANSRLERFLRLEAEIPRLCADLGLSPADSLLVDRYVDLLRLTVRNNLDFGLTIGRYRTF